MDLFLFSVEPTWIERHLAAGISGVVIDWEARGKRERQDGFDTQVNQDTPADVARVRQRTRARILCRVNPWGPGTGAEIEAAIAAGADEILLPMVRRPAEVEAALGRIDRRVGLGILIETRDAVRAAGQLAALPLSRVYVGLNDLAIDRSSANLFEALVDGTVEDLRARFTVPFGVAGVTLPEGGAPVPCELILSELARLRVDFTFLRRSYHRDAAGRDPMREIPRIQDAFGRMAEADSGTLLRNLARFRQLVGSGTTRQEPAACVCS